jgi:hypothetical protein
MIAISRQSASEAQVPAVPKALRHVCSAEACLAGSARVNFPAVSTGAFSLVEQEHEKHRPRSIVDGLRQHTAGKPLHVQIFDRYQAELVDDFARFFVSKIRSLIVNVSVCALKQAYCLATAIALLVGASGNLALATPQPGFRIPEVPGILDLTTIGEHCEAVQSDVDTDLFRGRGQGLRVALHAETNEPAAGFSLDSDRLDCPFDGPVQFHFDVSGALDAQFPGVEQSAAIAVRRKSDAIVAAKRAESRESWSVPALAPREESLEGFIDPAQDVLTTREVRQSQAAVRAHRLQLVRLIVIVDRLVADFPRADSFLQGCIVETGSFAQFAGKEGRLGLCRTQAIFEGEAQLFTLLPFDIFAHHSLADRPDRPGVITSAPKGRQSRFQKRELFAQRVRRKALQPVHDLSHTDRRTAFDKQMHVVGHNLHDVNRQSQLFGLLAKKDFQSRIYRLHQYGAPVLRTPDDVVLQTEYRTRVFSVSLAHWNDYTLDRKLIQQEGTRLPPKAPSAAS